MFQEALNRRVWKSKPVIPATQEAETEDQGSSGISEKLVQTLCENKTKVKGLGSGGRAIVRGPEFNTQYWRE
jgi:hypothetical protein